MADFAPVHLAQGSDPCRNESVDDTASSGYSCRSSSRSGSEFGKGQEGLNAQQRPPYDDEGAITFVTSTYPAFPGGRNDDVSETTSNTTQEETHATGLDTSATKKQYNLSSVSGFSSVEPHEAVRSVESLGALSEGAGVSTDDDTAEYPGPLALALIILGICLSIFTVSLDRTIITTATPAISARFNSYDDIGWYGSAYLLTASAFQPLYGRVYTSFETKSSFLAALAIFAMGSLVAALSPSSNVLIVGRAIQGLGSAGLLTGAFVIGTHSVKLESRPVLFAGVGILYGVGAVGGPLLGGAFTDSIGWRWCFWINLPIAAVAFVTVFFCFKRRIAKAGPSHLPLKQRVMELDIIGNIILLGATTMLFLAQQFYIQPPYSWSSSRCIGLLCGFGVTTLTFIAWIAWRGDAALIPPRIVLKRSVAAGCGVAFFIYGAILIHSYYLPIWFQAVKGTSAIQSGVDMIPYLVANAFFSLLAGIFVSKTGLFAPPAILGCAIGTVGAGLLTTISQSTSSSCWVGYEFLISVGLGMAIQQGFSAVQATLRLEDVPIGTAAIIASQSLGGAIFVSVGNTVLQGDLLSEKNKQKIPGVDIRAVLEQGATQFRNLVPAEDLPAFVNLYNNSLRSVFVAATALCGMAFLCSICYEFQRLKGKEKRRQGETEEDSKQEKDSNLAQSDLEQ